MRLIEGIIAAIPCFALAATMLISWVDPRSIDNGAWVRFGVGIMVLEFVLVHSGALMASMKPEGGRLQTLKVLGVAFAFYGLFAGAMAFAFQSWTLFIIYTTVMLSRWVGIFTHPEDARADASQRSGLAAVYYLIAVFLSVLVPWPELGVTSAVIYDVYPDRGGGHWERHPETALAAGVLYFGALGITELVLAYKAWRRQGAPQENPTPSE